MPVILMLKSSPTHHPRVLKIFFATEMWERYGFYVVQTLLALYLSLHNLWPDDEVYTLVASFTALTYITPVLGGYIADHFLGQKNAVVLGTLVLIVSYYTLSCNPSADMLKACLAGIAVGTGLLKSNISSLLGNQYPQACAHRERGFMIFYLGIVSGVILGTTLPSYLQDHFGWSLPFFSASIGCFFALCLFSIGIRFYTIVDYNTHHFTLNHAIKSVLLLLIMGFICFFILMNPDAANAAFLITVTLTITYMLISAYKEPKEQATRTLIILLLCTISTLFWAFYFQMFLSYTLFILRVVQPTLHGISLPAPYYVTLQSIAMLVCGLFFARGDQFAQESRAQAMRATHQFTWAMVIITGAFMLMRLVMQVSLGSDARLSPLLIIPIYLLFALAELFLSPTGLCVITQLASPKKVSTMMGVFFVSLGSGGFLAGHLAKLTSIHSPHASIQQIKLAYALAFNHLLFYAVMAMLITFIINRLIKYHTK